jgi:hypothetical protein
MLTSLYNEKHTARRISGINMPGVVLWGSLGSSALDCFDAKLEAAATNPIDSRRIRH